MTQPDGYPAFPYFAVLTVADNSAPAQGILAASIKENRKGVTVILPHGVSQNFVTNDITLDQNADRLEFVSDDTTYRIRELRDSDGAWLSEYHIDLPVEALPALISEGEDVNTDETLDAFATDDSVYIVGLVYTNAEGQWSRVDGDWVLLAPDDRTFDGAVVIEIDPERGSEYLDLYDENFVTVTDTEEYESAESEESEETSTDNTSDD